MDMQKKKQLFLIGGVVLAVLIAAVLLLIVFGGGGNGYQKHYDAAQSAFLKKDYATTLSELDQAIRTQPTEEAYLLMASAYEAQGDRDQAIQILYLGYSRVGGDSIADMLELLKGTSAAPTDAPSATKQPQETGVTVAGTTYDPKTTSVVLTGKSLGNDALKELSRLSELQNLSLADNAISDLTPLSSLQHLTTLQLNNNAVSDVSPLAALPNLRTLYLDGNPIRNFYALYNLTSLRTLSIKGVEIDPKDLSALEEALPGCSVFSDAKAAERREITLGGKSFYSDVTELSLAGLGLTDITELRDCRALVKLDLRDNKIRDISPLVDLPELEELNLWNNSISDITPLMSLAKLRYLDVDTNQVRDITVLEYLPELRELWLNSNELRSFNSLKKLTGLTRLGLKNTGLKDDDLKNLYGLTELKELNLEGNAGVSAQGFDELRAALPKCSITHSELLWTVTLGKSTYSSDAAEIRAIGQNITDLSGLEHFTALKVLELDDNQIKDLSPLYGLSGLRTLSVRGNGLSKEAVETARKRLPDCEIIADDPEEPEETEPPKESAEPSPEPTADPVAVGLGAGAAVSAAGTGSGYAILWCGDDNFAVGVREGFIDRAKQLGMNVVYDGSYPASTRAFTTYLTAMQRLGVDVMFLAGDDDALARVVEQAKELEFESSIIQVH